MEKVYQEYVVTFLNVTTNKVKCDCFMASSVNNAIHDFRECYRHDVYNVLSVALTGRHYDE